MVTILTSQVFKVGDYVKASSSQYIDSEVCGVISDILQNGTLYVVNELTYWQHELTLLPTVGPDTIATATKRLCECGAWSISWAPEAHSHWCPAAALAAEPNLNWKAE